MTRTPNSLREINPVMARAEVRRAEWELEATRKAGFWRRKRYDVIDLCVLLALIPSILVTIVGVLGVIWH